MTGNDGEVPGVGGQVEEIHAQGRPSDLIGSYRKLVISALLSGLLLLVFATGAYFAPPSGFWSALWLAFSQDMPLAALLLVVAAIGVAAHKWKPAPLELTPPAVALMACMAFAFCYAGHYLVLLGYDLQRDEQMVTFDAWIYGRGRLAWPLPPEWRDEAKALNLMFMPDVRHPVAWVSTYLPGNAMLHALFAKLGDQALTGPVMTALALVLVWSCARKLWPEDREAAAILTVLLAASGQVLLHGMSNYAMSAHLAFNLAWLRLFLKGRRATDAVAVLVGFAATGLHQPLFHPMFVGPFLLMLLARRRWSRLALFGAAYMAIGLFWMAWPGWVHPLVTGGATAEPARDYFVSLRETLQENSDHFALMAANLLRFMTWQHVALLPMLLAAWPAIRHDLMAAALALGLAMPIVVLGIILPYQGDGFGYRYLHPVLGNAVLLAGYGWRGLAPLHTRLRGSLAASTIGMMALLLPVQMWMSHRHYAPYYRANAKIDASGADYVIIDNPSLATNRPELSNRPIRLIGGYVRNPAALAARICRGGAVVAIASPAFFRRLRLEIGFGPGTGKSSGGQVGDVGVHYIAAGCTPANLD